MNKKLTKKHPNYSKFGNLLRKTRGNRPVKEIADDLGVSKGFVYQVEKGQKKPNDGIINTWASVYGLKHTDLWLCLHRIPMDLVSSLKEEPVPIPVDPFSELTEEEKSELRPYLDYVRWKIRVNEEMAHQ